jgi:hypothetical protein
MQSEPKTDSTCDYTCIHRGEEDAEKSSLVRIVDHAVLNLALATSTPLQNQPCAAWLHFPPSPEPAVRRDMRREQAQPRAA